MSLTQVIVECILLKSLWVLHQMVHMQLLCYIQGSIPDKATVQQSGLLNHLTAVDLVLANKGFLILDLVPNGVLVNIPPFLNNGTFTESEARATKAIAKCRTHVKRANARLQDFKTLSFIPSYLCCYADITFQLCASLGNLQFPLIKEGCEGYEFE